jgi:hypothetical protein
MTQQLREDEIVITNFQIEPITGIRTNLAIVPILENYMAYYSVEKSFLKNFNKPWILYDGRYGLDILSRLELDTHIIEYLQSNPLYIFLYEDLETAVGEYIDIPKAIIEHDVDIMADAKIAYENSEENLKTVHCHDFEYIREFKNKNKLNEIYVCSNSYIFEKMKNIYSEFKFLFFTPFLSEESRNAITYTIPKNVLNSIPIKHKFWCGNWRYAHHRHIMASYLVNTDTRLSWAYNGTLDDLNNGNWFDIKKWPQDKLNKIKIGIDELNQTVPLNINENLKEPVQLDGSVIDLEKYPTIDGQEINTSPWKKDLYIKNNSMCFCSIVNETRFAEYHSAFSEKSLVPMMHLMPFIIVGLPKTLELLKRVGFQTFENFWDESYDQETNNERRLLKILDVIDYIDSFSLQELIDKKKQMLPILEHNYDLLRTLPFDSPIYN